MRINSRGGWESSNGRFFGARYAARFAKSKRSVYDCSLGRSIRLYYILPKKCKYLPHAPSPFRPSFAPLLARRVASAGSFFFIFRAKNFSIFATLPPGYSPAYRYSISSGESNDRGDAAQITQAWRTRGGQGARESKGTPTSRTR